jgi:hypothetical protein
MSAAPLPAHYTGHRQDKEYAGVGLGKIAHDALGGRDGSLYHCLVIHHGEKRIVLHLFRLEKGPQRWQ